MEKTQQPEVFSVGAYPSAAIAARHGFTVVYAHDVEEHKEFDVKTLEAVSFLEKNNDKKGFVSTEVMCDRAARIYKADLGLIDAQYILDNQKDIPTKLCDKRLVFTGTRLSLPSGEGYIAYLYWKDNLWRMDFNRTLRGWDNKYFLVRCKPKI